MITFSNPSFRSLAVVAAFGLLCPACIINTTDDDSGEIATSDTGNPPGTTGLPSDSTGPGGATTDGDTDPGTTTDGPMGDCSDNLVLDPGFEAGSPNDSWEESSMVFETPICDAGCTDEKGAEPFAGTYWAWFGGVEDEPETASLSQTIIINPDMAFLSFQFQIRSGAGTGDDVFTVDLDGDTVFMVTDLDMEDYDSYSLVELDISDWADGGAYELVFSSSHAGTGLSSFFVDEVSLVSCTEETGTGSGTTVGQDTTAGTDSDTTAGTDSSGSSSGGGSSSTGVADG